MRPSGAWARQPLTICHASDWHTELFFRVAVQDVVELTDPSLSGILNLGGTILATAREKGVRKMITSPDEKDVKQIKAVNTSLELDCLVCKAGNGTQRTTGMLSELATQVIWFPKTIDNDVLRYGHHLWIR